MCSRVCARLIELLARVGASVFRTILEYAAAAYTIAHEDHHGEESTRISEKFTRNV